MSVFVRLVTLPPKLMALRTLIIGAAVGGRCFCVIKSVTNTWLRRADDAEPQDLSESDLQQVLADLDFSAVDWDAANADGLDNSPAEDSDADAAKVSEIEFDAAGEISADESVFDAEFLPNDAEFTEADFAGEL